MRHPALILWLFILPLHATTVTVVTEDFPPFQVVKGKHVSGLRTNMVRIILDEANVEYTIQALPWARAYKMALTQKNTLIYSMVRSEEREHQFHWIGLLGNEKGGLYKLKSRKDINIQNLQQAKKYVIDVANEDFTHQFLLKNGFNKKENLHILPKMDQARKMLYLNRVDLILDAPILLHYAARRFDLDPSRFEVALMLPELKAQHYMAFSLSTPIILVEKIKKAFEKVRSNGQLKAILDNWHSN